MLQTHYVSVLRGRTDYLEDISSAVVRSVTFTNLTHMSGAMVHSASVEWMLDGTPILAIMQMPNPCQFLIGTPILLSTYSYQSQRVVLF